MRKDIKTNKVVKALAIGLAASMAMSQPISVMAESAPVDSNDGAKDNAVAEKMEASKVEASAICDGAQDAVENAQEVVAVVPESEEVVADLTSIEGKLEETEMDIVVANGTNAAADKMVDETKKAELEAGAIADEMQAIVDDTDRIADEKIDDIKTATSIADANAANADLVAAVEAAEEKLADRTAAYDAAVEAYDKAVAEVKALEEAYNKAVADATEDANAAAEKLAVAKEKADKLAQAAEVAEKEASLAKDEAQKAKDEAQKALDAADKALGEAETAQQDAAKAKDAVDEDEAVQSGLAIADKETLTTEDKGLNWKNQDELFKAIMEEYYLPEVAGVTGATVTRVQGADNDSMNYFVVKDAEGNVLSYYNYKMDGNSKDKIVIFEKREVEVNGDPAVNPDQYVDEEGNVIALADIKDYIKVGDTYYEANEATGSETLISNSEITGTSTEDVTVSDTKTETYKVTEDGTLVKEVTADVTTVTYTGATFTSDVEYATVADRDAAAAAKKAELEGATGKDATVTETSETTITYVATGTYIPTFTATVTVTNEEVEKGSGWHDEANSEKEAVDYVYDKELGDAYDDDEKYYIVSTTNNMSVTGMTEYDPGFFGIGGDDSDYLVSGTASVTYAKVTKTTVNKDTFGAIWDDISSWWTGEDANAKVEEKVKEAIEAAGGIFVKANWGDGNWNKATVYYVEAVAVDGAEKESEADAKTSLEDAAEAKAEANGAQGVYNVKSTTEKIDTTTYSYAVNYLEKTGETKESKVVATETYADAEVLTGQIIQNKNYEDGNIDLTQDNKEYRAFVDTAVKTNADAVAALLAADEALEEARELTQKAKDNHLAADEKFDAAEKELAAAQKLTADSKAAAEAVIAAQAEVEKLQAAIVAMEGAGSNAKELADLAKDLDAANAAKEAAAKAFEDVRAKLTDALAELAKTVDRLTPDPDDDDDDEEEVVVEAPVVAAAPAPVAVTPVVAEPTVEEPVVEITENEVPLAEEIEETKDDVQDEAPVVIEEEEVPLAAAPVDAEDGMSWWWLLVVVVLGATGYEMYRRHKNKKAEAKVKKNDK